MIVWCAYCQHFQGEKAPLSDFSLTHSICRPCAGSKDTSMSSANVAKLRPIVSFYEELRNLVKAGQAVELAAALARGKAQLGLRALDLCTGILQPILYEMGKTWESSGLTVAQEHTFLAFAATLAEELGRESQLGRAGAGDGTLAKKNLDVLLVSAEGSLHGLGLRVLALALAESGISAHVFFPGLPPSEVLGLVHLYQPRVVGVAISLAEHIAAVRSLAQQFQVLKSPVLPPTLLVIGSAAVKGEVDMSELADVLVAPANPNDLLSMLRSIVQGQAKGETI